MNSTINFPLIISIWTTALANNLNITKTNKRDRFAFEYAMNGGNATQAYIIAGYSENGARQSAHRLLTNADVREKVVQYKKVMHEHLMKSYKETLQEVGKLAFFDPINMFHEDGKLKTFQDMDEATRKSIQEISLGPDGSIRLKFGIDKRAYLDMMMKYYNLYEAHQINVTPKVFSVVLPCQEGANS